MDMVFISYEYSNSVFLANEHDYTLEQHNMGNTFILVCSLPVNSEEDYVCERKRGREWGKFFPSTKRVKLAYNIYIYIYIWGNVHMSIIVVKYVAGNDRSQKIRGARMCFEGHWFHTGWKISHWGNWMSKTLTVILGLWIPSVALPKLLQWSCSVTENENTICGLTGQLY